MADNSGDLGTGNPGRDPGYTTLSALTKVLQERWLETDIGMPGHRPIEVLADFKKAIQGAELLLQNLDPTKVINWRELFRTEPVKASELTDLIDQPIPYLIKPIVVRGSLTQLQGIPKGGKSAFSVYLSLCATMNLWPYPQYLVADHPLRVLYIAWEDPKIMMAKRLSKYAAGLGLDRKALPEGLTFLFGPDVFIENTSSLEALKAAVDELKPDLVIIDTLSHIHNMEENSSSEIKIPMKNLDRFAKEMDIGVIYLHHTSKGNGDGKATVDKGRGSGAIAAAWHVLIDWGAREKGSNTNPVQVQSKFEDEWQDLAITYEKYCEDPVDPRLVTSIKWIIDGAMEEPEELGSTAKKLVAITTLLKRIEHKDKWWTAQAIAEQCNLGLEPRALKRHLNTLCEGGFLDFKPSEVDNKNGGKTPNFYRFRNGNLI